MPPILPIPAPARHWKAGTDEIGIDPDAELPIASLVKVPLAVAVLGRIHAGQLDGSMMIDVPPAQGPAAGSGGLSRFRHPARIAVDELLYLSTAMTDNTAADILFGLVSPAEVSQAMRDAGIAGISVRHAMDELTKTPVQHFGPDDTHLAHSLAIGSRTAGGGHPVPSWTSAAPARARPGRSPTCCRRSGSRRASRLQWRRRSGG